MPARDRRLTVRLMAEESDISKDTICTIVCKNLVKRKICSRFAPHMLTDDQKAKWMDAAGDFITMCDRDPFFLRTIITGDETWCYQFDPDSNQQSMKWHSPSSPQSSIKGKFGTD